MDGDSLCKRQRSSVESDTQPADSPEMYPVPTPSVSPSDMAADELHAWVAHVDNKVVVIVGDQSHTDLLLTMQGHLEQQMPGHTVSFVKAAVVISDLK